MKLEVDKFYSWSSFVTVAGMASMLWVVAGTLSKAFEWAYPSWFPLLLALLFVVLGDFGHRQRQSRLADLPARVPLWLVNACLVYTTAVGGASALTTAPPAEERAEAAPAAATAEPPPPATLPAEAAAPAPAPTTTATPTTPHDATVPAAPHPRIRRPVAARPGTAEPTTAPSEPAPTTAAPAEPAPTTAAPSEPAPTTAAPSEPAPPPDGTRPTAHRMERTPVSTTPRPAPTTGFKRMISQPLF